MLSTLGSITSQSIKIPATFIVPNQGSYKGFTGSIRSRFRIDKDCILKKLYFQLSDIRCDNLNDRVKIEILSSSAVPIFTSSLIYPNEIAVQVTPNLNLVANILYHVSISIFSSTGGSPNSSFNAPIFVNNNPSYPLTVTNNGAIFTGIFGIYRDGTSILLQEDTDLLIETSMDIEY